MADFAKTYDAVLTDFRAHGQPCTNWVPWEEMERADQAFLRGLMQVVFEMGEQVEFRVKRVGDG